MASGSPGHRPVALAVALLVVALAVHQAFSRELLRGPGYRVDQLVMMRLNPSLVQYRPC